MTAEQTKKKFEYDEASKVLTIFENGVYSIGPKDEEILMVIQVGEREAQNGSENVSKEIGSKTE